MKARSALAVAPIHLLLAGVAILPAAASLPWPFAVPTGTVAGFLIGAAVGVVVARREAWLVVSLHRGRGGKRQRDTASKS